MFVLAGRKLWRIYFFTQCLLAFLAFFPFFLVLMTRKQWFPYSFKLQRLWVKYVFFVSGISYDVKMEVPLDPNRAYIFCPNHTSYLDILVCFVTIPMYFHGMAKAELKKVPLFNIFFKKMHITVDRSSVRDSHRAFLRASSDLEKGISITIFPEATIPDNAPKLGKFKNGPFKLAIEKQVPIVPVIFTTNWHILPDGRRKIRGGRPGVAKAIVCKPIETTGLTEDDVVGLKGEIFEVMSRKLRGA